LSSFHHFIISLILLFFIIVCFCNIEIQIDFPLPTILTFELVIYLVLF
jgi:hypothetical protein